MASGAATAPAAGGGADTGAGSANPHDKAVLHSSNYGLLIFGIMLASLLQILDTTIANVAIPHMQSSLGTTVDGVTWVLTSYIIASAVALPITGWLADRVGARQLFIGSVLCFILFSMLCGLSQNLEEMVLFRACQGVAGAFIMPLSQSFMLDTTKPSRHPQIMALWGVGVVLGPILGPLIGGWLTESANWRWVFYVNLPAGLVTLAILIACLPHRAVRKRKFDMLGFVMLGIALASFQLLLDRGNQQDWFDSAEIWVYALLTGSATWMAIVHFSTASNPLFERELLTDRNFALSATFMAVMGVIVFAPMALLPPMLQSLFGYDVIDIGMVLAPRGFGVLFSMQISSVLLRRGFDPRPLVSAGFLLCAAALYLMAHWSLEIDQFQLIATGVFLGTGMGLVIVPLQVTAFATLHPRLRTDGSSIMNLTRSLGASTGISLMAVLLARNIQTGHEELGSHLTSATGTLIDFSTTDRFQSYGEAALAVLDAEVNRQAAMVAYVNDFYLIMWMALFIAPFAFLMRKIDTRQAGA